ncbi:MAG: hypothetical protein D6753_07735, partial [Planctomycetota bacterium]
MREAMKSAFLSGCFKQAIPTPIRNTGTMVSPLEFRCNWSSDGSQPHQRWLPVALCPFLVAVALGIGFSPKRLTGQELREELVYQWRFGIDDDRNSDQWPDGWQRRRDRAHPVYVEMELVAKDPAKAQVVAAARGPLVRLWHLVRNRRWDPNFL